MAAHDYRGVTKAFHVGAEIARVMHGGVQVWAKPDPLAQYYGTGVGQIPIDLRMSESASVTESGGLVSALSNSGGAGAVFGLAAASGQQPQFVAGAGIQFAASKLLAFNAAPNLIGVHFLAAIKLGTYENKSRIIAPGVGCNGLLYSEASPTSVNWTYNGPNAGKSATVNTDYSKWHMAEVRFQGGNSYLYWDGVMIRGDAVSQMTEFKVSGLGSLDTTRPLNCTLRRVVSVVCQPGYTDAAPEPAVIAARQALMSGFPA